MDQKTRDFNNALIAILIITLIVILCAVALRHVFGDHVAGIVPDPEPQQQYVSQILIDPPAKQPSASYAVPDFLDHGTSPGQGGSVYSE